MNPPPEIYVSLVGVAILSIAIWELAAPLRRELAAVLTIWRVRRQGRKFLAAEVKRIAGLKGKIIVIGEAPEHNGSFVELPGWSIDCSNGVPIHRVDEKGVYHFCGYPIKELIEIYAHRDDFVDRPRD